MSKLSIGLTFVTIALIIVAAMYQMPFASNGSGVLLVAGLVYAYWVAKRELHLLAYAKAEAEAED
ncbi:hypothetical protein [Erythrobacter sp. HKB08]|uniref:hypothetical protein n=1 Tax=Erythrobacter sp. HKB08 TaxID=2502843 RepID=UPI0010088F41|nr:hypothetical protein [Erythrobacter sp. HKB08]